MVQFEGPRHCVIQIGIGSCENSPFSNWAKGFNIPLLKGGVIDHGELPPEALVAPVPHPRRQDVLLAHVQRRPQREEDPGVRSAGSIPTPKNQELIFIGFES